MRRRENFIGLNISYPFFGLNTDIPSTAVQSGFSPNLNNIEFVQRNLKKRTGYAQVGDNLWSSDPIVAYLTYESIGNIKTLVAFTTKDHYKYDTSSEKWFIMGMTVQDCDDKTDWTASANITLTDATAKVGSQSLSVAVAAGFTTGKACYDNFTAMNLVDRNNIGFWFKSDSTFAAGEVSIVLGEDADGAKTGTYVEFLAPAYTTANEWAYFTVSGDFSSMNAVVSIGLYVNVDNGAKTFLIDDIKCLIRWSGSVDNLLDSTTGIDQNGKYLIVTNDVDNVIWWDGSDEDFIELDTGIPSFITCKTVEVFQNRLWLGNVVTTQRDTQTIAFSAAGDFTDMTGVDSGIMLISDCDGAIQKLMALSGRLITYASNSIGAITYVGGDVLYSSDQIVFGTTLTNGATIVNIGAYHLFMSSEDFVLFDGSSLLYYIGNGIKTLYQSTIDLGLVERAYGFYDYRKKKVYWSVPTGDGTFSVFVLTLSINEASRFEWSVYSFDSNPTAMGFLERNATLSWSSQSIVGLTWGDIAGTWGDLSLKSGFPELISGSSEMVFAHSSVQKVDGSSNIDAWWDSQDFTLPEIYISSFGRWLEVEFEARGDSVDVYYSINFGSSYTLLSSVSLTNQWTRYRLFLDKASKTFRLRFREETNDSFEFRWIRVWAKEQGA